MGFWKKIKYGLKKLIPGNSSPLAREEIAELLEESFRETGLARYHGG